MPNLTFFSNATASRWTDSARSRFQLGAGLLALLTIGAGFGPGLRAQLSAGMSGLAPILHLHAAVMGLWQAVFMLQLLLVFSGAKHLHRRVGGLELALRLVSQPPSFVPSTRKN